jgi:hypothetical protein
MGGGLEDGSGRRRNPWRVFFDHHHRLTGPSVDEMFEAVCAIERVELATRESSGVSVALYWTRRTDALAVTVDDTATGDQFELVVADNERPLDVFYHPFAYARARGLELMSDRRGVEVGVDA